jgi:hypothetical protein
MKLNYSPFGVLKLLGASILGGAICYGYVGYYARHFSYSPALYGAAWVALVAFVGVALLSIRLCMRRGVAVEFTDEGLHNMRSKWPLIRWDKISHIRAMRLDIGDFIVIEPGDGFPPEIKLDPDGTTSFGFTGLTPGRSDVFAWLEKHHPELVASSSSSA